MRDVYYAVIRYETTLGVALGNSLVSYDIKTDDDTKVIYANGKPEFVYLDNKIDDSLH